MTPLERNPKARRVVYGALWFVGLALTGAQAGIASSGVPQPTWLSITLGAFPAVAAYVGFQAQANTPAPDARGPQERPGAMADDLDHPNGAEDYQEPQP